MYDTIATLNSVAFTFLSDVPPVAFVLVGKVVSANEPCSIDGV